jgi:hypothetical protein
VSRRTFLGVVGFALLAAPLAIEAEQAGGPRIGALAPTTCLQLNSQALREGPHALGYVQGQTIIIDCREAASHYERVVQQAAEHDEEKTR